LPDDVRSRFTKPPEHPFGSAAQRSLIAFYRVYAGWMAAKEHLTVAGLLDKIAEEAGYATWLRDGTEEGEDRWENLQELHSVAAHYDDFPPELRLTAFLEEVALVSDQDELIEDNDRATLLTLHTAKGLEFPVVFIVGLEENILPHSRSQEDPDQMEEERRLMYVGVTRAKDRLYLVRAFRRTIWGRSEVNEPSRFLRDVAQAAKVTTTNGGRPTGASPSGWRDSSGSASSRGAAASAPSHRPATASRPPSPAIGGQAPAASRQSSAAAKSSEGYQLQFKPGDRVNHGLFGEGIVLKSAPTLDDEEVTVAFPGKGTKTLLASFAKLRRVT
jgi:DNA helicase-2/ATP-dependent DNA helicase PcrA